MRLPILGGLIGFVLAAAFTIDGWLPGGPYLAESALAPLPMAAFVIVFVSFSRTLFLITGRGFGRLPASVYWPLLRALPRSLQIALGILFLLCLANMATYFLSPQLAVGPENAEDSAHFYRAFAGNIAWIGAAVAGMAYGHMRKQAAQGRAAAGPIEPA